MTGAPTYSCRRDSTGLAPAARTDLQPTDSMAIVRANPPAARKVQADGAAR
jgi:hypothetical protein